MTTARIAAVWLGVLSAALPAGVPAAQPNASTPGTAAIEGPGGEPAGEWRQKVHRPAAAAPSATLFESRSWAPPPPPPPPRASAPKSEPVPPAFPYFYMGRVQAPGKPLTVYLTRDERVFSAGVGEVIDGTYRVVDIGSDRLDVVYLPLGKKQQIALSTIVQPEQPQPTQPHPDATLPPPVTAARLVTPGAPPSPLDNPAVRYPPGAAPDGQQVAPGTAQARAPAAPPPVEQPNAHLYGPPGYSSAPIAISSPIIAGTPASPPPNAPAQGSAAPPRDAPQSGAPGGNMAPPPATGATSPNSPTSPGR
jgi:hypothetical protein